MNDTEPGALPAGDEPALDRLAEDWIKLWQEEIAALVTDPELAVLWRQAMTKRGSWLSLGWPGLGPQGADDAARSKAVGVAHGAADAAASCGDGQPALGAEATLRARIDALESRLATLEGRAGGGGADRRGARRRKPPT